MGERHNPSSRSSGTRQGSKGGTFVRLPTPLEVRRRIEQVGDSIHPTEDRRVAKDVDEYQLRMAMEYQYLVAGRVSEIAGKYQPGTNLAYPVYINSVESLLLPTKTAKRKTEEGWSLRGPAVPFDPNFEPWAEAKIGRASCRERG